MYGFTMSSWSIITIWTWTVAILIPVVMAAPEAGLKTLTYSGCFTSSETFTDLGPWTFQTSGYCQSACVNITKPVMGLNGGTNCWCGDMLPAAVNKVDDHQCDYPCAGFDKDTCGGEKTWQVYLTGTKPRVENAKPSSSSTASTSISTSTSTDPSSSRTTSAAVVTLPPPTRTVTASTQTPTHSGASSNSSPSGAAKAGIAAGVAGAIAFCALIGGTIFFIRQRRRRAVVEEYRRKVDVRQFVAGGKPESSTSLSDSRLDPSMVMQRRESDASMADYQDYSRRILKVTNPDHR